MMKRLCVTKKDHFLTLCQGVVLDVFRDVSKTFWQVNNVMDVHKSFFAILIRNNARRSTLGQAGYEWPGDDDDDVW